jgi:hypothetical protein
MRVAVGNISAAAKAARLWDWTPWYVAYFEINPMAMKEDDKRWG